MQLVHRASAPSQGLVEINSPRMREGGGQLENLLDGFPSPLEQAPERFHQRLGWPGLVHSPDAVIDPAAQPAHSEQPARFHRPQVLTGHRHRQLQAIRDRRNSETRLAQKKPKDSQPFAIGQHAAGAPEGWLKTRRSSHVADFAKSATATQAFSCGNGRIRALPPNPLLQKSDVRQFGVPALAGFRDLQPFTRDRLKPGLQTPRQG